MDLAGKPVLLVEDNTEDAILMVRAWKKAQIPNLLIHAADGLNAVEILRQPDGVRFGSVLLDIKMPGLDGFETLKWIKANPKCAHLPVLMLSASSMPGDMARAAQLGATEYFVKPTTFDALVSLVQKIQGTYLRAATPSQSVDTGKLTPNVMMRPNGPI